MSTAILYLNMGGEMLYVLQQRLQTQKISPDKTIQVMNEVIRALLEPQQLAGVFAEEITGLAQLRPLLERVVLSSIMRLDASSMGKLFVLMIMMVKYQLATCGGPRELVLSTLNHLDAIRDMAVDRGLAEHVDACHRLVLQTYGPMTHAEVWHVREQCLREVQDHNVRVSILLRLGMQNQDASFNRLVQAYDERYQERRQQLDGLRLEDIGDEDAAAGQLGLRGERATLLGKNAYCSSYGGHAQSGAGSPGGGQALARSNRAMRLELQSLATQLGREEAAPARPFSLQLFGRQDSEQPGRGSPESDNANDRDPDDDAGNDNARSPLNRYKSNLIQNVNSEFADNDNTRADSVDLMNLLDIV